MKPVHPLIKIFTVTIFLVLMSGFVALKSGAFETVPGQLPPLRAAKIIHRKFQLPVIVETKRHHPLITGTEPIPSYISSSKTTILADPWQYSSAMSFSVYDKNPVGMISHTQIKGAMMSSSKSSLIFETPFTSSLFQGIFSGVPLMKVDRPVLKQGKK